ncbi:MAG TPA: sigma-70 family RNA polymerase sigma factor [bacterium]
MDNNNSYNDNDLIKQSAEGNEQSFALLVKKYEKAVFSTIYRYTGNKEDVEDLAQEIFIKVWKNAKSFKERSKFSTWLYRIVVNHCLNYKIKVKKQRRDIPLEDVSKEGSTSSALIVQNDCDSKVKVEIIKKAIRSLPKRQRLALILAQFEDKSHQEIADIMKVSPSSVHSLIFRARITLRKMLKELL